MGVYVSPFPPNKERREERRKERWKREKEKDRKEGELVLNLKS